MSEVRIEVEHDPVNGRLTLSAGQTSWRVEDYCQRPAHEPRFSAPGSGYARARYFMRTKGWDVVEMRRYVFGQDDDCRVVTAAVVAHQFEASEPREVPAGFRLTGDPRPAANVTGKG